MTTCGEECWPLVSMFYVGPPFDFQCISFSWFLRDGSDNFKLVTNNHSADEYMWLMASNPSSDVVWNPLEVKHIHKEIMHKENIKQWSSKFFFQWCYRQQDRIFERYSRCFCSHHCVRSVRIWSFSGPYFPTFRLSISPYLVRMRENTYQKNTFTDTFHAVHFSKPLKPGIFKTPGYQVCTIDLFRKKNIIDFSMVLKKTLPAGCCLWSNWMSKK